ncbi:MAG: nucleotidyltransferase family protein, partial [Oscillospiraceae bacterium]|nr:nucleotidyltransferase family protein [Oscillospiraceae bacterium]
MKICGIVAEYNPFHNGHARHIAETRALLGADTAIVCVMSGDFVQRGGPAVFPRHTRAEAAVRGGADLVIELPLPWAMRSAEGFASGAASLAAAAGAEYLSFGSESGDLHALDAAAALLLRPELDAALRRELQNGSSY